MQKKKKKSNSQKTWYVAREHTENCYNNIKKSTKETSTVLSKYITYSN